VNFAIRPRGAKDLNILGKHQRESILIHDNKGCREGAAVRKDRTLGGGVDAMIVINGEDADEARPVAAAAAVDAAAAAAAADVAAVAVLLDARLSALAAP